MSSPQLKLDVCDVIAIVEDTRNLREERLFNDARIGNVVSVGNDVRIGELALGEMP